MPVISTPRNRLVSHFPARVEAAGGGNVAGEREHQGDGVLRRRDRVAERRVHHDHALRRRRGEIDIVDADAGPADHLEAGRALQHLGGDLRRRADRKPVEAADDLGETLPILAKFGPKIDLDAARLENGRRRLARGHPKSGLAAASGFSRVHCWQESVRKPFSSQPGAGRSPKAGFGDGRALTRRHPALNS